MNKKIIYLVIFVSLFALASSTLAQVEIPNPLGSTNTFGNLIADKIIPAIVGIIGSLATIMIIIAGILYLTSAGSPERINTAKKALMYAIIGIVIAVAAGTIAAVIKTTLGVT
jgi:hypothetical protein